MLAFVRSFTLVCITSFLSGARLIFFCFTGSKFLSSFTLCSVLKAFPAIIIVFRTPVMCAVIYAKTSAYPLRRTYIPKRWERDFPYFAVISLHWSFSWVITSPLYHENGGFDGCCFSSVCHAGKVGRVVLRHDQPLKGSKSSCYGCLIAKSWITFVNTNENTTLSEAQGCPCKSPRREKDPIRARRGDLRAGEGGTSSNKKRSEADLILDSKALDSINKELIEHVTALQGQNAQFRAKNEKVKQHYEELYDSIKITRAKTIEKTSSLFTKSKVVPLHQHENVITSETVITEKLSNTAQKPFTRYKHRNKQDKALSTSIPTIAETQRINASMKYTTISSNQQDPTEFGDPIFQTLHLLLISNAGHTDHPLVFGLRLLKTYDEESLSAQEFFAFRKHSCYVRNEDGVDLLKGSYGSNLYTISVEDMMKSSPTAYYAKPPRTNHGCGIVVLTEFYESVGIFHQKSVPRIPQQNDVVERRNRTHMEAARTMLLFSKAPMFLWVEAVATACYTQNRSLIHTLHIKTPYELVHDRKPSFGGERSMIGVDSRRADDEA
ncbi:integrase, catalytic region, zinc finger, CCHC-type containing protein [Tanacetum coccineum]